jgi:competence protein ComEA
VKIIKSILVSLLALFAAAAFAAVDVNKASQAELEGIKGIGPSMSAKILDARKTGAFKDWADMQSRVKGVRNGNSAKFSADGLTVNGAAFTAVATDVKPAKGVKSPGKTTK